MSSTGVIKATEEELQLETILLNGQTERWVYDNEDHTEYLFGTAMGRLWRLTRKDENTVEWTVIAREKNRDKENDEKDINRYFQMDVKLEKLYAKWQKDDKNMVDYLKDKNVKGLRILHQDPFEGFFRYSILAAVMLPGRMPKIIKTLCMSFGKKLDVVEHQSDFSRITMRHKDLPYSFPTLDDIDLKTIDDLFKKEKLANVVPFIKNTVTALRKAGGEKALEGLTTKKAPAARDFLMKLPEINEKMANTILAARGFHSVIPVDGALLDLCRKKKYLTNLKSRDPVTGANGRGKEIEAFFTKMFGDHAAWAMIVLHNAHKTLKRENATADAEEPVAKTSDMRMWQS